MFRAFKLLDTVTLFHKPSIAASSRALALLKQASTSASETALEDQATPTPPLDLPSGGSTRPRRGPFQYNVTEDAPTKDELRLILEYMAPKHSAGDVVEGARNKFDALSKCEKDGELFKRPVLVDWNNGKAVIGADESAILKLLREEPEPEEIGLG